MRCRMFFVMTVVGLFGLAPFWPAIAANEDPGWSESISGLVESVGDALISPFTDDEWDVLTSSESVRRLDDGGDVDEDPFWDFLEDAGYKMKQAIAEVGVIPGFEVEYVLVRELSEADRNALDRSLEIDSHRRPGLYAAIKRQIIRTLVDASDFEELRIEELIISLLPLPSAQFVIAKLDTPLDEQHDMLYRSIQDMQRHSEQVLREMIGSGGGR